MRKVVLVSLLALGVTGCVSNAGPPQVRDLSVSRDEQPSDTVTVQAGDTLYGVAWRQGMDFRKLAQLNNLTPPYRLQPGQTLRLNANGSASAPANQGTAVASATAAGASGATDVTGSQAPDWLAPDTQAIQRNQRLSSRPLDGGSSGGQAAPSGEALAAAGAAAGSEALGPIYNYDSPGADGQLSDRDRAEREALAQQRAKQSASANASSTNAGQPSAASSGTSSANDTNSSSAAATIDANESGTQADAGTAVAGEPASASQPQQRTYTPVKDIPWQWPSDGQMVGRFGDGSNITAGIDIAGQKGQPVRAAGPGIVVYAGNGVRGYGNLILLKHNDRFLSAYAHNDSLKVEENDVVNAGEVIATMGNTDAESVKLHFEVRKDGQPKDPLEFLPPR